MPNSRQQRGFQRTPGYWSLGNPLLSVSILEQRFHRREPLFQLDQLPHLDAEVHDRSGGAQPNRWVIETACLFDQIPWEERQDYVDLKLNNMFSKLGKFCQFSFKPAKKDS